MYRNAYGGRAGESKTNQKAMGRKEEKARNNLATEQSLLSLLSENFNFLFGNLGKKNSLVDKR